MTSDSTGEIYVIVRTSQDGSGVPSNNGGGSSDQGGDSEKNHGGDGNGGGIGNENSATTGVVGLRSYDSLWLVGLSLILSLVGGAFLAVG